ncbi:MAG: hypothetical protein KGP14_03995 [Betaproteobacteria bacterium]|nr:hypothetical protein [Betaproteobacteria bacterium]
MKDRRPVSSDSPGMRRVVAVLEAAEAPLNGHQIAERAHIAFNTFQNQYRQVLATEGKIHLAGYEHNTRGPFMPTYRAGPAPAGFVPRKPRKITSSARSKDWKLRTGYNEARKAERRRCRPPDRALAALMGISLGATRAT